jgi:SAM-dependent methyltransferase
MGWFKHWFGTRYYSVLYGHRDELDAKAWVDAILGRWALPAGSRLLDLACGRGRHARWFVASVSEARVLVPGARFLVHDMRVPLEEGSFDAVCCLFTSLGYFDDLEDDRAVFRAVATMLRPGGRFVLDFMNTDLVLRDLVTTEQLTKDGIDFRVSRTCEQGVLVKRILVSEDRQERSFEERVQALTPDQLEQMASDAGFLIEDRTDGPDLVPFDPSTSQRFVLWMRKPQ